MGYIQALFDSVDFNRFMAPVKRERFARGKMQRYIGILTRSLTTPGAYIRTHTAVAALIPCFVTSLQIQLTGCALLAFGPMPIGVQPALQRLNTPIQHARALAFGIARFIAGVLSEPMTHRVTRQPCTTADFPSRQCITSIHSFDRCQHAHCHHS